MNYTLNLKLTMCRKRFEPHKCKFVPNDEIVLFCLQNSNILEPVHMLREKYLEVLRAKDARRREWVLYRKRYHGSAQAKIVNALLLLKFNWTDSYINTGDALNRVMCIYKENRDEILAAKNYNYADLAAYRWEFWMNHGAY